MESTTNTNVLFTGSVARHYDKHLGPVFFEPYALEIASRIDPSSIDTAVEIACGTGRVTRHLRNALKPSAKLIATDISPDMMGVAQEILKDQPIEWQIADAQELPFKDNSIDLVVCAFGYMFLPDKVKGFSSAHRVLKPGGKLLFTTWDKLELNGASLVQRSIAGKFLGDDTPPSFYTAFSMNNEAEIRQSLQTAGFNDIDIESVEKTAKSDSAKEMAGALTQGGTIYDAIVKCNPDWVPQIQSAIEKELVEKFGAAPMLSPMRAVVVTATKDH